MTADLAVSVAGLPLKHPVMAGSGEATMTAEGIRAALEAGAAAVVAKSANESAAARRQLAMAEYAVLDASWRRVPAGRPPPPGASYFGRSGLVDVPFERWVETLAESDALARDHEAYVVASLIVAGVDEAARMAKELETAGLRWLELNVGAPHAGEAAPGAIRAAASADDVGSLVGPVRQAVSMALTVKLPGEGDLASQAEAAVAAGADAVCIAGRFLGFLPDPETRRPVLGTFGAMGGGWALPLSLRWIAKARALLGPDVALVGTNGARSGEDVVRFLLAGASAVELTTSVILEGPGALTRAIEELTAYCDGQGVAARDLVGEAADHTMTYEEAGRTPRGESPG
ncbi:MAG: dihydroorotate dehydrogenase [Actinomycetota bacterium]